MEAEKQKNIQHYSDQGPLLIQSFFYQGILADLTLYPSKLKLCTSKQTLVIPLSLNISYDFTLDVNEQPTGIIIYTESQQITLIRDFWPRLREWQALLIHHAVRRKFHKLFDPIKIIGKGNFASVYKAVEKSSYNPRIVAIKAFSLQAVMKGDGKVSLQNQIKCIRKLNSPNIAKLYGVYKSENSVYVSMELVQGTTLDVFLKKNININIENRRTIIKALLIGVKDLQQAKIIHRDLKPQNIMINSTMDIIKIVDFGLATHIDQLKYIYVRCGTPGYVAPQILRIKDLQKSRMRIESDMFSLGAIYYQILYGRPLFSGKSYEQVLVLNRDCKIELYNKSDIVQGQLELLSSMLQVNPAQRITAKQALESQFMKMQSQNQMKDIQCSLFKTNSIRTANTNRIQRSDIQEYF